MSATSSSTERPRGPREWVNVGTCLAYVVAGAWAAWARGGAPGYIAGGWLIALGGASAVYHWREWDIGGARLDQAAMYGTFVALAIHAATPHHWAWPAMLLGGAAVGWRLAMAPDRVVMLSMVVLQPTMVLLGSLVLVVVLLEGQVGLGVGAFACFAVAWWVWHKDWAYGHGTWHVLTAAAILMLFLGVR